MSDLERGQAIILGATVTTPEAVACLRLALEASGLGQDKLVWRACRTAAGWVDIRHPDVGVPPDALAELYRRTLHQWTSIGPRD